MSDVNETYLPDIEDFRPEKWWSEDFTKEKKLACLQYVEDIMAKKHGRKPRDVVIEDLKDGVLGVFRGRDPDKLFISSKLFEQYTDEKSREKYSPFQALDTVIHEGRHAFQYDNAFEGLSLVDQATAELWMKCFVYEAKDPDETREHSKYSFNPTEEDARLEALKELKDLSFAFKDCDEYVQFISYTEEYQEKLAKTAQEKLGSDFREQVLTLIEEQFKVKVVDKVNQQQNNKASAQRKLPAFLDFGEPIREKRRFSILHLVFTVFSVLWFVLMYIIARPHGFLHHALWAIAAVLGFLPAIIISLKKGLPKFLRNRVGGVLLLIVYLALLLLIQLIYKWLFIVYIAAGIIFLLKAFNVIAPDILTIEREEADGTKTIETRILGDNPEADIAAAERQLKSEGYTIKK